MKQLFRLSDKTYDKLKWICIIFIPATSVAYAALANTWGLPFGDKIPATLSILETFFGSLLCISTAEYRKYNPTSAAPEAGEKNGE